MDRMESRGAALMRNPEVSGLASLWAALGAGEVELD
jgi:hypothetical protein